MRSLQNAAHFTINAVQNKLLESRNTSSHNRRQIIYLIQVSSMHLAELIAPLVNLSLHSIYKIVERYNIEGASPLLHKEKGGRRRFLISIVEEKSKLFRWKILHQKDQLKPPPILEKC